MGIWQHALKAVKELKNEDEARENLMQELSPPVDSGAKKYNSGGYVYGGETPEYLKPNSEISDPYQSAISGPTPNYLSQLAKIYSPTAATTQPVQDAEEDSAPDDYTPSQMSHLPSRAPAAAADSPMSTKDLLSKYLQREGGNLDNRQKLVDAYKDQLDSENARPNMSNLNALADYYWGSNLSKTFAPPKKESEKTEALIKAQQGVDKETQPITAALVRELGIENSGQNALNRIQAQTLKLQNSKSDKADKDQRVYDAKLGDKISTFEGRGINTKYAEAVRRGQNVEDLINQYPNTNMLDNNQVHIFANEIDGMINSGAPTIVGAQGTISPTLKADWNAFMSRSGGNPQPAEMGAFIERLRPYVHKIIESSDKHLYEGKKNLVDSYKSSLSSDAYDRHMGEVQANHPVGFKVATKGNAAPSEGAIGAAPLSTPPAGQKWIRNKRTGETKLVPQ